MTDVTVTPAGDRTFAVEVDEGGTTTHHRVTVPDDLAAAGLPDVDPARLVEESFAFLLEREPATSILSSFELPVIGRYFPEYPDEIARRVG